MNTPGPGRNSGGNSQGHLRLQPAEFAARFQEASRVLWTIAAGVLGDPTEAEDVLQEAAIMALGKLEQFEPGTNFTGWMGSFVRNVALNHARKRLRRSVRGVDPDVLEDLSMGAGSAAAGPSAMGGGGILPGPGSHLAPIDGRGVLHHGQTDFDDRVLAGLRELGPDQRAALLLRTVLDMSFREVSEALGIPEGTAMSHVHRARVLLRERMSPEPDDRGPRAPTAARGGGAGT